MLKHEFGVCRYNKMMFGPMAPDFENVIESIVKSIDANEGRIINLIVATEVVGG